MPFWPRVLHLLQATAHTSAARRAQAHGRRTAMACCSLFFLGGPAIMAVSFGVGGLVLGRAVVGFGIGMSAVVCPVYLGEV